MAQSNVEPKPEWLDTIAPVVSIQPFEKVHNGVFSISMSSSERGSIWYRIGTNEQYRQYKKPLPFTRDGSYHIYFYAEDDFGNKTTIDSSLYVLDTKKPEIVFSPPSGAFRNPVYLHVSSNEKCSYYLLQKNSDTIGVLFDDSVLISTPEEFRVKAVDVAGNITITKKIKYIIDTTSLKVSIDPPGGIYNRNVFITFKYNPDVNVWYTFDPLASTRWFRKYDEQFSLPHGLSSVRYFTKSNSGIQSEIFDTRYIVDTIPPNLLRRISNGTQTDTLVFFSREQAEIKYTRDGTIPTQESEPYSTPLIIPRTGIQRIKARAWDVAGNTSEIVEWEYKYDFTPPELTIVTQSGTFNAPFALQVKTNEPAQILYTLDNTPPDKNSLLYTTSGIIISREDTTILRVFAIDSAGNQSKEQMMRYFLDTKPPHVKARIEGSLNTGSFLVSLIANEPAIIYYEIGGNEPGSASAVYENPLQMSSGQVLKYFAVDNTGNKGAVAIMDELRKPLVEANPGGGVYNRKLEISFSTNAPGVVYWRLLPDTSFTPVKRLVTLNREGLYTFEYFLETDGGLRSSIYRQEYVLDWTPPAVEVSVKKGLNDSAIIFLQSGEKATYYYTIDGTNPLVSSSAGIAGNKYLKNNDRIVIKKEAVIKFSIYAEDLAGNQSALSVLDILSPRAVPDVPAGNDRLYEKALSITFSTFDDALIYYTTDGSLPNKNSDIFSKPLTLLSSDTVLTLVADASGYIGVIDTFIYHINLPPTPLFVFSPDNIFEGDMVTFDASASFDKESDLSKLKYRWDFNGDGVFDTDTLSGSTISYKFINAGYYKVKLEVYDELNNYADIENVCIVKEHCPIDMVSVVNEDGTKFCVDIYEWPNVKDAIPKTDVSWVEAKMSCIDAGKRLCTANEWTSACQGLSEMVYPYSDIFENKRCSVEEKKVSKSGSFSKCETNGAFDMLGNVWEWVEDKNNNFPLSYGGSFRYGRLARCNLKSEGNIASKTSETGFRCCK